MSKNLLLSLFVMITVSCSSGIDTPSQNTLGSSCPYKTELSFPAIAQVKQTGTIDYLGNILAFEYISDTLILALGTNLNNQLSLFTSHDSGHSWSGMEMTDIHGPSEMYFNHELGLITFDTQEPKLLKTTDQGQSWEVHQYSNLSGHITQLQYSDSTLYALLKGTNGKGSLIKSEDLAETWTYVNFAPSLDPNFFCYSVHDDHLYIAGDNQTLIKYSMQGEIERIMDPPVGYIWDIEVIDENQIIVVGNEYTVSTSDGGLRWNILYEGNAKLIDFEDMDKGLILVQNGLCQEDAFLSNDAIASTIDGGITWESGNEVTNLSSSLRDASSVGNGSYILLINNSFYTLKL